MAEPLKSKLVAGIIGAAVIGGLVAVGGIVAPAVFQASVAAEVNTQQILSPLTASSGSSLDDTHLARFDGDYYAVETEPGVSLAPITEISVKKIGYGRISFVNVATTSSGVYSSEGLFSPHFRYPGIHTDGVQILASPLSGQVLGWSRLTGWTKIPLFSANSIGFLDDLAVPASQDGVCVKSNDDGSCR
jgi:hypothetical protein